MMTNLKILSFNVKGINDYEKRLSVFGWCKEKKADIFFLQETHSTDKDKKYWCNNWGGKYIFRTERLDQGEQQYYSKKG